VGELGHAFRDMPWKTLDFFSPTSADAGLLDIFTLSDAPVIAGRVNPNTPHAEVLEALLGGASQNVGEGTTLSPAAVTAVANDIVTTTKATPFRNRGDIVADYLANTSLSSVLNKFNGPFGANPLGLKIEREAIVRALAESANTRTWNLLIDIVAQSGKYPSTVNASALVPDQFVVEGQRHYWLHLAIDRYTGEVVDQQLEPVDE
jgi:hypothetical protein